MSSGDEYEQSGDDYGGGTPFDDWLSPADIFGKEQWEENQIVVDRAHDGSAETNRNFRQISFYIPTGFHFMLAYIEHKSGKIEKRYWDEYKKHFPRTFKGARAVDLAVKKAVARTIHNENHHHLHMLALGHHPRLVPLQRALDLEGGSLTDAEEEDRRPADVVLLLKKLLHKSVGWRSELPSYRSFIESFQWDKFTKEEKRLLVDLIEDLPEKQQRLEPNASPEYDEIPF
ncbi:hypothetical protein [Cochlodiniinecator piscidefendens]|uniref:hypothetical protein n=1 Tax=Cochlodiniinecator piscidefendens TaxID=2715756 RepID=UPI001407BF84|nr:hypothetical protein [Cochlodiniinecator piscidefendens]